MANPEVLVQYNDDVLINWRNLINNKWTDPGKSSWPELLGAKGEDAKEVIERENPKMKAVIILDGTAVPEIFICSRVYVWVNDCGIVVQIPIIG